MGYCTPFWGSALRFRAAFQEGPKLARGCRGGARCVKTCAPPTTSQRTRRSRIRRGLRAERLRSRMNILHVQKRLLTGMATGVCLSMAVPATPAELRPRTIAAFDHYVEVSESGMSTDAPFLWLDTLPSQEQRLRRNELRQGSLIIERMTTREAGQDGGYLWRLNTYWRFLERDGGTYLQCESITLTRGIPVGFGWLIRPFVTGIPRESLEFTLTTTRRTLAP